MIILKNISEKIEPGLCDTLLQVAEAARGERIDWVLIGATARDLLFTHVYGVLARRATMDADVAVRVADWDQYNRLVKRLQDNSDFKTDPRVTHRFKSPQGTLVDIVPFGALEDPHGSITWPGSLDRAMSTCGFEEALESAIALRISVDPDVVIRVASAAALAVLKLIAWKERPAERSRDAVDLFFILQHYSEVCDEERLTTLAAEASEADDFDRREAGVRLLGHDMRSIARPEAISAVSKILESETEPEGAFRLVTDMIREEFDKQEAYALATRLLTELRDAFKKPGQ